MKIKTQSIHNFEDQEKPKVNPKKLMIIFSVTFAAVLLLCATLASLFTPKIDVPALNNEDNLSSMSSNDFKGRVDSRLKMIELQEQTEPVKQQATANTDQGVNLQQDESLVQTSNSDENTDENFDDSNNYDNTELPYDSRNPDQLDQSSQDQSDNVYTPQKPKAQTVSKPQPKSPSAQKPVAQKTINKPPTSKPQNNLDLRDKVRVENPSISMAKVMVGSYSSPAEAARVSQSLTNSDLNVTPFIKERNGSYTLQVGSFSSSQKAEGLANELRRRNLAARVIQE